VANDWVDEYAESWSDDDRRRKESLRLAKIVADGSRFFIKKLWETVENDLARFHGKAGDTGLRGRFRPESSFILEREKFPVIELDIQIENGYLSYTFRTTFDHASETQEQIGKFMVAADENGRLQVRKNGGYFKSYAELSQFLLKLAFDYLRQNL